MNNLPNSFSEAVKIYLDQIIRTNNAVVGVALTGSAGRNDVDQYSDIDNVVFVDGAHKIKEGKFIFHELLFDTRIANINKIARSDWTDDMYSAYFNSYIIYDPNNIVKNLISEKRIQWESIVNRKLALSLVNLSIIYKFDDNWKALKTDTHYDKFLKRKDYISLHRLLTSGFEIILDIFYLMNKTPVPDMKNKIRLLKNLAVLPADINKLLSDAFTVNFHDEKDSKRRYYIMTLLITDIKKHLEKSGIKIPDNLYSYYLSQRD